MEKKEESKKRISEYLHSLRISSGYKTLREWCRLNDFSDVLWSHLENGLWEIVPTGKKLYTQEELDKAREEGFDSGVEKTVNIIQEGLDELLLEKDGEKYWVGDILRDCGSSVEKILPQNMKHYLLSKLKNNN